MSQRVMPTECPRDDPFWGSFDPGLQPSRPTPGHALDCYYNKAGYGLQQISVIEDSEDARSRDVRINGRELDIPGADAAWIWENSAVPGARLMLITVNGESLYAYYKGGTTQEGVDAAKRLLGLA